MECRIRIMALPGMGKAPEPGEQFSSHGLTVNDKVAVKIDQPKDEAPRSST